MGSLTERPENEICQACGRLTEKYIKYLDDRLCNKCASVLWAGQVLLDNRYTDERKIAPTMVFAALAAEDPRLGEIKESLATAEESARASLLRERFIRVFEPLGVWALVEGIPIIHKNPIEVSRVRLIDAPEESEKVTIDVVDVSAKPEQVAETYKSALGLFGLNNHPSEESEEEGQLGWQVAPGIIHMEVYRVLVDPDIPSILWRTKKWPDEGVAYPSPGLVAGMYSVLRDFYGRSVLPGNLTNKPEAKTLVPACAAWYLTNRGSRLEDRGAKVRTAGLLNRHLLTPCGLEMLWEGGSNFIQLWGNVRKRAEMFRKLEEDFTERLRHREFAPDYFSPSPNK
jgi:hypothetical protein